jgi:hypothetical protein
MKNWYYISLNGEQLGPVNDRGLIKLARKGMINQDTLITFDGLNKWIPAKKVKDLFPPLAKQSDIPTQTEIQPTDSTAIIISQILNDPNSKTEPELPKQAESTPKSEIQPPDLTGINISQILDDPNSKTEPIKHKRKKKSRTNSLNPKKLRKKSSPSNRDCHHNQPLPNNVPHQQQGTTNLASPTDSTQYGPKNIWQLIIGLILLFILLFTCCVFPTYIWRFAWALSNAAIDAYESLH